MTSPKFIPSVFVNYAYKGSSPCANEMGILRHAHDLNDEMLKRIYIGRRFKYDTDRLDIPFELYTKMTADPAQPQRRRPA